VFEPYERILLGHLSRRQSRLTRPTKPQSRVVARLNTAVHMRRQGRPLADCFQSGPAAKGASRYAFY